MVHLIVKTKLWENKYCYYYVKKVKKWKRIACWALFFGKDFVSSNDLRPHYDIEVG